MVMAAAPEASSSRNCRHSPFATMVPASPPPTIRICLAIEPSLLKSSPGLLFRFPHNDAPVSVLLRDADHLVTDLLDPFRNILDRALVARPNVDLVSYL